MTAKLAICADVPRVSAKKLCTETVGVGRVAVRFAKCALVIFARCTLAIFARCRVPILDSAPPLGEVGRGLQYIICSRARLCRVKNILQLFCEKTCTVRKIAVPLHPQNERGPCEGKPEWRPPEVFCARPWGRAAFFDRLTRDECSTGKDKKRTVIL